MKLELNREFRSFVCGMLATIVIVWFFPTTMIPQSNMLPIQIPTPSHTSITIPNRTDDTIIIHPNTTTFYDDPELSYSVRNLIQNWDEKRSQWLASNPSFSSSIDRVMMVTGTQPTPCTNPDGDHYLLRLFKNKVDYCRLKGYEIFYNNVLLDQEMYGYWAKYSVVKAAMIAHPEVEWIWWIDSDAVVTDMDWTIPFEKYKGYNLIVYGWPVIVEKYNSSMGLNAGVFLIRNCQWSMELLDRWANFGPQSKDYAKWGQIQMDIFVDKTYPVSDDQAALCYMIKIEKERWGDKILVSDEYYLSGYFEDIIQKFENVSRHYKSIEKRVPALRKRQAEISLRDGSYSRKWDEYLKGVDTNGYTLGSLRRPFVTHFTGCEPCSGGRNTAYSDETCRDGMVKALNFADSQVLRSFGYTRPDLLNTPLVELL